MKIRVLVRLLRKSHKTSHSWDVTAREFGITKGMAYQIAVNGYDPADDLTRSRLGLDPRPCPTCHHKPPKPPAPRKVRKLHEIPEAELRWMLEHRIPLVEPQS